MGSPQTLLRHIDRYVASQSLDSTLAVHTSFERRISSRLCLARVRLEVNTAFTMFSPTGIGFIAGVSGKLPLNNLASEFVSLTPLATRMYWSLTNTGANNLLDAEIALGNGTTGGGPASVDITALSATMENLCRGGQPAVGAIAAGATTTLTITDGPRRAINIGTSTPFGIFYIHSSAAASTIRANAGSFIEIFGIWAARAKIDANLDSFNYTT